MATGAVAAFKPAQTLTLAATTTSVGGTFADTGDAVLIYNATATAAFVVVGNGAQTATLSGFPVLPGAQALIAAGPLVNGVAVILPSGTGSVYATIGNGTQR